MRIERKAWGTCIWFSRFRIYLYHSGYPRVSVRRNP